MLIPQAIVEEGGATLAADRVYKTDGAFSTNSTSFVDITGASVTLTTGASRVLVSVSASGSCDTANGYLCIDVVIDGSSQGQTFGVMTTRANTAAGQDTNLSFTYLSAVLSAGSHTIKLQLRTTTGNASVYAQAGVTPLVFSVVEIPV